MSYDAGEVVYGLSEGWVTRERSLKSLEKKDQRQQETRTKKKEEKERKEKKEKEKKAKKEPEKSFVHLSFPHLISNFSQTVNIFTDVTPSQATAEVLTATGVLGEARMA